MVPALGTQLSLVEVAVMSNKAGDCSITKGSDALTHPGLLPSISVKSM